MGVETLTGTDRKGGRVPLGAPVWLLCVSQAGLQSLVAALGPTLPVKRLLKM